MRLILPAVSVGLFAVVVGVGRSADPVPPRPAPLIPVMVTVSVESADLKAGGPIPLAVTIRNDLPGDILHSTYRLEPNGWNGETAHLSLVDIYREGEPGGWYQAEPKLDVPRRVSGMASHRIESGKALTVRTDARKWEIVGGWKPGKYRVTVRVHRLDLDDGRCQLSVHSAPVEFEVQFNAEPCLRCGLLWDHE